MNLPDFVKTKKFWEAVSLAVSGLLALLVFFGKVDASWAVPAAVIFGWVSALLKMFGIELELRYKALEERVAFLQNTLLQNGISAKGSKKLK
jgi:hypothetical protein